MGGENGEKLDKEYKLPVLGLIDLGICCTAWRLYLLIFSIICLSTAMSLKCSHTQKKMVAMGQDGGRS